MIIILQVDAHSLFFKMQGSKAAVQRLKSPFLYFGEPAPILSQKEEQNDWHILRFSSDILRNCWERISKEATTIACHIQQNSSYIIVPTSQEVEDMEDTKQQGVPAWYHGI